MEAVISDNLKILLSWHAFGSRQADFGILYNIINGYRLVFGVIRIQNTAKKGYVQIRKKVVLLIYILLHC